jgi:hypothetical protein
MRFGNITVAEPFHGYVEAPAHRPSAKRSAGA